MSDTEVKNGEEKPQNPPAFPFSTIDGFTHNGMDLRDYFAALTMQGMASFSGTMGIPFSPFDIAKRSYELADAMLKQRTM